MDIMATMAYDMLTAGYIANSVGSLGSAGCCSDDDGSAWFENDSHQNGILEMMKLMYDSRQLTDVCVSVDDRQFHCHRAVLAATSRYFHAMFTANLVESRQTDVRLQEVDSESVGLVVDYAYTGRVRITRSNVQNLMAAASLFQIAAVFEACARYMQLQLDDSNCVGVFCFAHVHQCVQLRSKALEHIEKNFVQVSRGEEFVNLDADLLHEILESSELNVDREELVYDALLRWLNVSESKRSVHLPRLLPTIRCGLLPSRFIREQILANRSVLERCRTLLRDIERLAASPDDHRSSAIMTSSTNANFSPCIATLRSGMIKPEHCILFIGGIDDCHPSINCYNPLTRETYYTADVPDEAGRPGYYTVVKPACVVTDDNQIYMAGGSYVFHEIPDAAGNSPTYDEDSLEDFEDDVVRKNFYAYDADHNRWVARAPMLFPKSNFALANVAGRIFCFGGLSVNQHPSEIVESYDVSANQWKYVGMMPSTLVDLSAVVHNQLVYVLGGRTGITANGSTLRFDPRRSEWSTLAPMPLPRFNFGACIVGAEIYVIGGQRYSHSGHTIARLSLRSVDIYSIESDRWRCGPALPVAIYNVGAAVLDGAVYASGTLERHGLAHRVYRRNVVYRLDLVHSAWTQVEADLCAVRDFTCVAARMHTRKLSQIFRPDVDT